MKESQRTWVGGAALAAVLLLGLWWFFSTPYGIPEGVATTSVPDISTIPASKGPTSGSKGASKATDVASIASSISSATEFGKLLTSTGVKSEIAGKGPYTVFVPTDSSISTLPKGTITGLSATEKKRLVRYHVVVGRAIAPDGIRSGSVDTLSRDALNFLVNDKDGVARVNSRLILKSYTASNGIVHLIDGVLLPPVSSAQ